MIPLVDDDLCEAVLLNELATAARKVGVLKRKEALYKFLAMRKFGAANDTKNVIAIFNELAILTKTGFEKLSTRFV